MRQHRGLLYGTWTHYKSSQTFVILLNPAQIPNIASFSESIRPNSYLIQHQEISFLRDQSCGVSYHNLKRWTITRREKRGDK
jgi:hypothetical protein